MQTRSFLWLLRAHLITLATACYLYSLAPIDWLSTNYNVRRIMAGDLAPAVQLSVHPLNPEGLAQAIRLTDHPEEIIAAGIRALLADASQRYAPAARHRHSSDWSDYQLSHQWLLEHLRANREKWKYSYQDETRRKADLKRFADFAYQWY